MSKKRIDPKKWASKWLKTSPLKIKICGGMGSNKPHKVMSNADRRALGRDQDPDLPDFDPNYKKEIR